MICSPPSPRLFASCCICIQPSSTPHLLSCFLSCFLICFFPFCISEHVARSKNLLLLFLQLGEFACDSSCHDGLGTVPLPLWLEVFLARFPIFWVNVCMLLPLHFFLALSCKPAVVGADDKVSTRVCVCVAPGLWRLFSLFLLCAPAVIWSPTPPPAWPWFWS